MSWNLAMRQVEPRPWLVAIDPRLKLAWVATISLGCIWFDDVAALVALCLAAAGPLLAIRLPWRAAVGYAGLIVLVVWSTVYAQAVFYRGPHGPPLLTIIPAFDVLGKRFPGWYFHGEGASYGAGQSLRFAANLLAGSSVALSTSPERLMSAMVALRIPNSLSFMCAAALRSLPITLEEWAALRQAYRLRAGTPRAERSFRPAIRLHEELRLLEPLLANTLRRAAALALAVRARGFDVAQARTNFPALVMNRGERAALFAIAYVWALALVQTMAR